ncbi:phosphatidylglycerol lysyltransferase domain-containing protein [uncultured Sphingobacterium sp.]|uniref:phosphatidylglycerol lysyltransferase domain-containing protein n=1 Tax=uncultured Sphingobacterium sp. TaxID=182688 RepID=UPI0025E762FF|nr:phosphatidylglycerol lysyltransferase domain-containing protein [uncultured Sphingobacterium sp.]
MKNWKVFFKIFFGLILLFGGVFFFIDQRSEVIAAGQLIQDSAPLWLATGAALSLGYIFVHGLVYTASFKALSYKLSLPVAIKLFLKRNFVGVFLPAGGFTSIALFRNDTAKEEISRSTTDFASVIYTLVNLLSLLLLSLFVLFFWGIHNASESFLLFLAGSLGLCIAITYGIVSFYRKKAVFRLTARYFPSVQSFHQDISSKKLTMKPLILSLVWALVVELIGIFHLYVSMLALHLEPSMEACLIVYTVATLFYCFSPFMKGVGLVEISMVVLLCRFGYTEQQAISISLLYRLFEFWVPLLIGGMSFFVRKDNILVRVLPAIFLFVLGLLNIISAIVPSFFSAGEPIMMIFGESGLFRSTSSVLLVGIVCILCAIFLFRGLRAAWYLSLILCLVLCIISFKDGKVNAEGIGAFVVVVVLLYSYRNYFVPSRRSLLPLKYKVLMALILCPLVYGLIGFSLLHRTDFTGQATVVGMIKATFQAFVLLDAHAGYPHTLLGHSFIYSLNLLGAGCISVLIYSLLRPVTKAESPIGREVELAQMLLEKYGRSPVDYFKTYGDKSFYFNANKTGFIAYKITFGFAVVLEGPVCANNRDIMLDLIQSFERYCRTQGLKVTYYRVDIMQLGLYQALGKKHFLIGEEAIVDVTNFNLQGKKRKSLRNAVNTIERKGYQTQCYRAPLSEALIAKLRLVSDSWLIDMKRSERVFSQGMFEESKVRNSDVITLEDEHGTILSFLNIIPDYTPKEATYDLIRKTDTAPGGNMDVLLLRFISYCKEEGYEMLNMGLAPLSGFERKKGLIGTAIHFLYNNHKYFKNTRGLREFKEKYDPLWIQKYIIYSHDIDLLTAPLVINKVMRVKK